MYLKIYQTESKIMVAVCDQELIGKTFCEGELTIQATEEFYKGDIATTSEVGKALEEATIVNLLGEKAVACAVKKGYIDRENVLIVDGVPHAQWVRL